jgi:hypothetical protein
MLITPVGALASHNVTRSTGGCLQTRLIPCIMSDAPAPFGSIGSGQSNGFDIEAPARTGPCFKSPDAPRGISDNSTESRSVQRAIGRYVRFIRKPGRALSGNPAVAGTPAARPTIWISGHYTRGRSEFLHEQINLKYVVHEECLQLQGVGRIRRRPAPWHGSCQTWPNQ